MWRMENTASFVASEIYTEYVYKVKRELYIRNLSAAADEYNEISVEVMFRYFTSRKNGERD